MEIRLIDIEPVTRRVSFRLQPKVVTGVLKLAQVVIISLLNIPGKDILDPTSGGGLPELIGFNIGTDDMLEITSELTRRIRKTEAEVLDKQIGLTIAANERLKEIQILLIGPGASDDEVLVRLRIINELGQQLDVVV
jgi:hypothetical protein